MSQPDNAFIAAAAALAKVEKLVLKGDDLQKSLQLLVSEAAGSSQRVEASLQMEVARRAREAEQVCKQYSDAVEEIAKKCEGANAKLQATTTKIQAAAAAAGKDLIDQSGKSAKDLADSIKAANGQLEATTRQIKAAAIKAVNELKDTADTAVKLVSAEVTIAQDGFERAAQKVEGAAGSASDRIVEASQRVDRGTAEHREKLEQVSVRLGELLTAFETGATVIASASEAIRLAKEETLAARAETSKARDEVVTLRVGLQKQVRVLIAAVALLFITALGTVFWAYLKSRSG
jgi:hypothetical protein